MDIQNLLNKQYRMERNGMWNGMECCGLEDKMRPLYIAH